MSRQNNVNHVPIETPAGGSDRPRVQERARRHSMARQNLWGMVIFLFCSICAYSFRDFNPVALAPETLRQILGCPPPAYLVSIALMVYCFAATTHTLTAIASDVQPEPRWQHLGYRCAFYMFYSFSGAIAQNFLPVLLVGLALYLLDQSHIRFYNTRILAEERALLNKS